MANFRPYAHEDVRIVSDWARFEFENPAVKSKVRSNESDTTSNTDLPSSLMHPVTPEKPRKSLLEIAEASKYTARQYDYGDIYQYYMKPSTASLPLDEDPKDKPVFDPYPRSIKEFQIHEKTPYNHNAPLAIPKPPGEHQALMGPFDIKSKDLPPIIETKDYYRNSNWSANTVYSNADQESFLSKRRRLEEQLMKGVMGKPLFTLLSEEVTIGNQTYTRKVEITANFFVYAFEMIIAIIIVTLSSILLNRDHNIGVGIYRFFIAESSIAMFISILFMSTIVNYERRNGSFYCLAAFLLSVVSFIITTSHVIPRGNCDTASICKMRKANSAFIIISAFLWLCNLVAFLTTLYISRMNLLQELNFDYSNEGVASEFNKTTTTPDRGQRKNENTNPLTGQPLKEYFLNAQGDMFEVNDRMDLRGRNKILVYTEV